MAKLLDQHSIALQFAPGTMSDEEFEALTADIKKRGQQHPIIVYEEKILDGMHRYRVCNKLGITPIIKKYEGDDPSGMVIALNVLRRKVGTMQRAVAGAHLNLEMGISQDEASRVVGVSKVAINITVQVLKSKNARLIKLLETPELTREQLIEQAEEAGIIPGRNRAGSASVTSSGAMVGLPAGFFSEEGAEEEDLIGDGEGADTDGLLDGVLGDAPPSANGKVLTKRDTTAGGMPTTGSKPSHPERRNPETPASKCAQHFKGLSQEDQISFVSLSWHILSKAILASGKKLPADPAEAAATTAKAIGKAKAGAKAETGPKLPAAKAGKGTTTSKAK